MKTALWLPLLFTAVLADIDIKGSVALDSQMYGNAPDGKHNSSLTLYEKLEVAYEVDALRFVGRFYAQQDYYDLHGDEKNERTFTRIDELFGAYDGDSATVTLGRVVRFWGALEARNIVDVFNPLEGRNDPFVTDKAGAWQASYAYYTDTGEITAILKFSEEDQRMAAHPYLYYFFPEEVHYEHELSTEASRYRPTLYLSWTGSTESEYPVDYALILQHGYDSQRYFEVETLSLPPELHANAYLVNKVMSYNTMVVGSTLLKLEALYTDVIDEAKISDYAHGALGVEHTLTQLFGASDLGLIAEYYRYHRFEDTPYSDLELFETIQNDLFVGVRWSANDASDTSLVAGVIADWQYNEQSYYAEYATRLNDTFVLRADLHYIEPSSSHETPYALLGRHQRLGVTLSYYF